ncbi:MAG: hypothetical protein IT245_05425 [Bacteroidia bacterium]|nr:hypothetical protein [Bacteroidia bacterium]
MKTDKQEKDYYINDQGLCVFTETYHLKRGYCCGCACKHCPFGHINVPKQKKVK